jgi:hypothetical protein
LAFSRLSLGPLACVIKFSKVVSIDQWKGRRKGHAVPITARPGLLSVTESSVTLPPDQGNVVLEYQPISSTDFADERPRCPRCHQPRMPLSKIEAGPAGLDYRTFECQNCGRVHTMIISSDPMQSGVRDWLEDELKPPA